MTLSALYALVALPFWTALLLIPIGIVTYFASITITMLLMANGAQEVEFEENPEIKAIHDDLKAGNLEPGSQEMLKRMQAAGITEVAPIGAFSKEVVGYYNGHTMFEWVEIRDPRTKKLEKYYYHSPGRYNEVGAPIMPEERGKVFAYINGVVYSRDLDV